MPEALGDDLGMDAGAQGKGGVGVLGLHINGYLAAKTKSAILVAASSCSAGMACE